MFNNISKVLESFGLLSQHRSVYLQFSDASLNSQVFLQRIDGKHHLNQGMTAELICLSTHAHIALKQFIGVQVAVDQVTDQGQLFRTTGIITGASQGQSDGALTLYKLNISDPTYLVFGHLGYGWFVCSYLAKHLVYLAFSLIEQQYSVQ